MLPNPHLFIPAFQQLEALLSSRIEGTIADPQEFLFADLDKASTPPENVREVRNYIDALNLSLKNPEKLPVCLRSIREAHKALMRGVRGQEQGSGECRDIQNYVGKPGASATLATFPRWFPRCASLSTNSRNSCMEKQIFRP